MRTAVAALIVTILIASPLMSRESNAQESETGVIFGTVINGTTDEPVPEVTVTLSTFDVTLQENQSTVTDGEGRFEFAEVSSSPDVVYAVSTSFFGIAYSTGRIGFEPDSIGLDITLDVYEPTDDQSLVAIFSRGVILTDVEPVRGEVGLLDIYFFGMSEPRVLVANDEGRAVNFPVPRNATRVTPLPDDSYDLTTATIEGATIYGSDPLIPGETTATLSYTIPYTDDRLSVELQAAYETELFRILVPTDLADLEEEIELDAPGFEFDGQEAIGPQTYSVWSRENVSTGDRIQITYSNLVRSEIQPNTLNKLAPTIIAVALALIAIAAVAWIVRTRQLERERPLVLVPQLATSLEERRRDLIDQLRALEQARDEDLLDEEHYADYRRQVLEQIRVVNRQMRGEGVEE